MPLTLSAVEAALRMPLAGQIHYQPATGLWTYRYAHRLTEPGVVRTLETADEQLLYRTLLADARDYYRAQAPLLESSGNPAFRQAAAVAREIAQAADDLLTGRQTPTPAPLPPHPPTPPPVPWTS